MQSMCVTHQRRLGEHAHGLVNEQVFLCWEITRKSAKYIPCEVHVVASAFRHTSSKSSIHLLPLFAVHLRVGPGLRRQVKMPRQALQGDADVRAEQCPPHGHRIEPHARPDAVVVREDKPVKVGVVAEDGTPLQAIESGRQVLPIEPPRAPGARITDRTPMRPEPRIAHVTFGRHFLERVLRRGVVERLEIEDDYGEGEVHSFSSAAAISSGVLRTCSCMSPMKSTALTASSPFSSAGTGWRNASIDPGLTHSQLPLIDAVSFSQAIALPHIPGIGRSSARRTS